MKTFRLYWFFTLLLLLAGCNQKDDVNEISPADRRGTGATPIVPVTGRMTTISIPH